MIREIVSRANPHLKKLVAEKEQYFLFEGKQLVHDLVDKKIPMTYLIITKRQREQSKNILQMAKDIWFVSDPVMSKLSSLKTPSDYLAVVNYQSPEINLEREPVIIILDNIQDPANAGTVFRCAAAFGINAILFSGDSVKATNPKFIRTAQTSLFDIRFKHYSNIRDLIREAKNHKLNVYLTSSKSSGRQTEMCSIKKPAAVIFGNEGQGLSPELLNKFPVITISQKDCVDSLNVGVSACIIMHELMKKMPK
jgi:TrmH family RNA methyltransferase